MEAKKRYILNLGTLFIILFIALGFYYRDSIFDYFSNGITKNPSLKAEKCRQELNSYGAISKKDSQYRLSETVLSICQKAVNKDLEKTNKELYQKTLYNLGYANFIIGMRNLKDNKNSQGNFLSTESAYKDYLSLAGNENNFNIIWQLANLYFYYLNDPQKAKSMAETLISLKFFDDINAKEKTGVYNLLGRTYLFLGDYEKAEENLKKALSLKAFAPDEIFNIHVRLNLAGTLVEAGKIKEGMGIIKETDKINPKLFGVCLEAGIYYFVKDYKNSVAIASKYADNPWCSYVLGISYAETNKKEEAKINLQKFIYFADNFVSAYKTTPFELDIDYDAPAKSIFFRRSEENAKKILQNLKQ